MSDLTPSRDAAVPAADVRARLLSWFDRHARDLPWRGTDDPYAIWVSEVMLQQTRVETVIPYYRRWMRRFPDVEALAGASEDDVLKAWEGLGYYRRARALHGAAALVRDRHGGALPRSADGLRDLPGVGEYTAGAVASIAFGEAVPAVDGNVRRVLSRLFDEPDPAAAWLRDTAAGMVDPERPGDANQALMELGATVCTPRAPGCGACPVADGCRSLAADTVAERPAARARKAVPTRLFGVALLRSADGRFLVVRRPGDGLLGGLWAFPEALVANGSSAEAAARAAAERSGTPAADTPAAALPEVRHAYSHFRGVYRPFVLGATAAPSASDHTDVDRDWADEARVAELALPRAHRRITRSLARRG